MKSGTERARWYVVYCKPREESRAAAHLENQGMRVLFPRIRSRKRVRGAYRRVVEPMFPRYVFVRLGEGDNPAVIRSTRGAVGLVRFGELTPSVPDEIVEDILQRSDEAGCVDLQAETEFRPGETVRVAEGAFAGAEALFAERSSQGRVAVLLEIMQRQQKVELAESAIVRARK